MPSARPRANGQRQRQNGGSCPRKKAVCLPSFEDDNEGDSDHQVFAQETQRAKAAASTPISSSSDSTSEEDEQQCKNITKEKARAKKLQCQCPLQPLAPPKYQPKNKAGTRATTAKAISSKKNKEKVSKKDKGKEKKKKEEAAKK